MFEPGKKPSPLFFEVAMTAAAGTFIFAVFNSLLTVYAP
jgi:hypothetical protein